jgi:hypothetical protein
MRNHRSKLALCPSHVREGITTLQALVQDLALNAQQASHAHTMEPLHI